jgi:hypothetical protein
MKHATLISLFALLLGLFVSCSNKDELIPVAIEGKWGYINNKGEYVITPRFYSAEYFHEDLACVKTVDGNVGYIDARANFVVKPEYKDGSNFREGFAVVVKNGEHPVCINSQGKVVFTLNTARKLFTFNQGLAAFQDSSKKYGYVNTQGKVVIAPKYDDALAFSEDLAPVKVGGKWGYIDKTGKMIISVQFASAKTFSEGLAAVSDGYNWGYIGSNGLFVITPQFEDAGTFSNKRAIVTLSAKKGFINNDGKFEINPIYDGLSDFHNGLALMQLRGTYGFLDAKGNMAINAQFAEATDFIGDVAVVKTFNQYGNNSYAIANESGTLITFPKLDKVKHGVDKNYVEDNFYDATEIVEKFTKRISGNSVDGFSVGSTLQSVANSVIYGNYVNAVDTSCAVALNNQKITDDAVITKTAFYFPNSIYSLDSVSKTTLVYDFAQPLMMYEYTIELRNEASNKGSIIAKSLSQGIASKVSAPKVVPGGDMYYALQSNKKLSYVIFYTDEQIHLFVSCTKKNIESLINKRQNGEE